MNKLSAVFGIVFSGIKKWGRNPRIYIAFLTMAMYAHSMLNPINGFCQEVGVKITPWIFPFFMSNRFSILFTMLGAILLFCDAPFIDESQPYVIMRSGRKTWAAGQLMYIFVTSIIYFAVIFIITLIIVLPNLMLSTEWGKVIGTFTQTKAAAQYGIRLSFDFAIQNNYAALAASGLSMLLSVLVSSMLGILMFLLNLRFSRFVGAIAASALALLQIFALQTGFGFTYFSPVSWVSLSVVDITGTTMYPSVAFALIALGVILTVLAICSMIGVKSKDIDVMKSI